MKHNILVHRPRDLTVAWAQRIVDNHSIDTIVSRVDIISVDIGTTTRVRVIVEHNGPETLPRRWFVKLPSLAWRAARWITALPRLLHTEVRFYNEITEPIPISRPSILAAQSRFGWGSTLVLTDVTEFGASPGCSRDALTAAQAALIVEQLAYFLATALHPETRRLHEANLLSSYVQILMNNGVAEIDLASQLQRYRAHLVYPFEAMLVTLAIGGMMDLESNLELIRRTGTAVEDLDAFAVMPT